MYSKIEKLEGSKEGNRYTNNLVNILIVICTVLFAFGFERETLDLAVKFTRISLVGIYFTGLISIFNVFLQIKGNYAIPALMGFPLNFFTILAIIIISSKGNVALLAIGSVIATASQVAEGGITALSYASRLNGFVQGIFVLSITTVLRSQYRKLLVESTF